MRPFDVVIVSDLHLGARNSHAHAFLDFLSRVPTERLILNGDVFDDPRLRTLRECDIEVLEALRMLAREIPVDWLRGNHDPHEGWFRNVLGLSTLAELELNAGGRRFRVVHGDRWDRSMAWPGVVVNTADAIYRGCQWLDPSHRLARSLKHRSKWFVRAVEGCRRAAIEHARQAGVDGIILGHTHVACDSPGEAIHYLNCGCWTETPHGFVGIRGGVVRAYYWTQRRWEPVVDHRTAWNAESFRVDEPLLATTG